MGKRVYSKLINRCSTFQMFFLCVMYNFLCYFFLLQVKYIRNASSLVLQNIPSKTNLIQTCFLQAKMRKILNHQGLTSLFTLFNLLFSLQVCVKIISLINRTNFYSLLFYLFKSCIFTL